MIKWSICQKVVTILNVYVPDNSTANTWEAKTDKTEREKKAIPKIIAGDLQHPFLKNWLNDWIENQQAYERTQPYDQPRKSNWYLKKIPLNNRIHSLFKWPQNICQNRLFYGQ